MSFLRKYQRFICTMLTFAMLGLGVNKLAIAAMVTTEDIVTAQELNLKRDQVRDWLSRDAVRDQLIARGVDPAQAQDRVTSMTNSEVVSIAGKIDELPAGGDGLELLLIIFLVLVITDLLGVTDIFTFIKKR
jgi:hypothetical protein